MGTNSYRKLIGVDCLSFFGEEIIDRLHEKSALRNKSNPVRKIIDNGVGGWFDRFDDEDFYNMFFLDSTTDGYLDCWGKEFNVPRKLNESDDSYRQRIILESLGHLTVPYLQEVYGLTLYCYVADFDPTDNDLTSDNPLACNNYMCIASDEIQSILNRKFIIDTGLTFIDLSGDSDE